jgi:hypothetical protein
MLSLRSCALEAALMVLLGPEVMGVRGLEKHVPFLRKYFYAM